MPCNKDITISTAIDMWLRQYQDSPKTFKSYKECISKFKRWLEVNTLTGLSITRADLINYIEYLKICYSNPATIHTYFKAVRIFLKFLYHDGIIDYAFPRRFKLPRINIDKERYLSDLEIKTIQSYIYNLENSYRKLQFNYVFNLFFCTGCRLNEIANATMDDIKIERSGVWLHVIGKGGYHGKVPILSNFFNLINEYREYWGLPNILHRKNVEQIPLVTLQSGKTANKNAIYNIIKRLFRCVYNTKKEMLKLKKASPHWLRHTYATQLIDAGVSYKIVQQNLRHKSFRSTQRYIHVSEDDRHNSLINFSINPRKYK